MFNTITTCRLSHYFRLKTCSSFLSHSQVFHLMFVIKYDTVLLSNNYPANFTQIPDSDGCLHFTGYRIVLSGSGTSLRKIKRLAFEWYNVSTIRRRNEIAPVEWKFVMKIVYFQLWKLNNYAWGKAITPGKQGRAKQIQSKIISFMSLTTPRWHSCFVFLLMLVSSVKTRHKFITKMVQLTVEQRTFAVKTFYICCQNFSWDLGMEDHDMKPC